MVIGGGLPSIHTASPGAHVSSALRGETLPQSCHRTPPPPPLGLLPMMTTQDQYPGA